MNYIKNPKISVLLCTYNGEKFLKDQLKSYENQTIARHLHLLISDDGSKDGTIKILKHFKKKSNLPMKIFFRQATKGFSSNFVFITSRRGLKSDFYAWSDQDDIWLDSKLERALSRLKTADPRKPAVYCSRTIITDESNKELRLSKKRNYKPSFENALVQSIAGGNTMVFNESARVLFNKASYNQDITSHDWLMYIITKGVGGYFFYDELPSVRYRQHGKNLIGSNNSFWEAAKRIIDLFKGELEKNMHKNARCILNIKEDLDTTNRIKFSKFYKALNANKYKKIRLFLSLRIHRQSIKETFVFYIATFINKV